MLTGNDKRSAIERVREKHLNLAIALKEHNGIRCIVEKLYPDRVHFIFELLQNAEDTGATEVEFELRSDCLSFEHNGRPFSVEDIHGITNIGKSTKSDDADTIGQFGAGFKAVFVYTDSPRIWSPTYSFEINDLFLPSLLDDRPDLNGKTRFEFPFNNPKKAREAAYTEVEHGLRDLSETTLLFLNHLQWISWKIGGGETGTVARTAHTENHIEVLKEINDTKIATSHFLRFTRPVEKPAGQTTHKVATAFALEFHPEVKDFDPNVPLAKQMKVAPAQGQVAVFFSAGKETSGLRFHLHAPFIPELSRASIKETPKNELLFEQLAALCAASMHDIKALGLLRRDFLGVLPNSQDTLGERYGRIRDVIIGAFNEEALMPTFQGGHSPGKHLFQGKASLKELLSARDIDFLIRHTERPPLWAVNRDLQGTNVERFMSGLAIQNWDVDDFFRVLKKYTNERWHEPDETFMEWLSSKPAEWLQRMYSMLASEHETARKLGQLLSARIIRLRDGSFSTGDKCHFPDGHGRFVEIVPCVDHNVLEVGNSRTRKKTTRKFLEELGVTEIGERQLVEAILKKEYRSTYRPLNEESYLNHLRRFLELANDDSSSLGIFRDFRIFLGADGVWHTASEIYLDLPYEETGMSDYYDIVGLPEGVTELAEFYAALPPVATKKLVRFAGSLGARREAPISKVDCQQNPEWDYLRLVPGQKYTQTHLDEDHRIENFDELVLARNARVSRLIWHMMYRRGQEGNSQVILAQYRKNSSSGTRKAHSQVVHQLRKAEWVPQGDRNFVRPALARAELLPRGFTFDSGWDWIEAIEFGKEVEHENEKVKAAAAEAMQSRNRRSAAAAVLGWDLDWLERFKEVPHEQRERFLREWEQIQKSMELPGHESRNPDRRAERVGAFAADAPERRTEQRMRSVAVGREEVKAEADQYLKQQYRVDGNIICQVCRRPMPFKLDDGSDYFERVEFLSGLRKRHLQNYLALCPNHAAMFRHANSTEDLMMEMFIDLSGNELEVVLAQENASIHFTKTHIDDLKKVIEIDGNSADTSDDDDGLA